MLRTKQCSNLWETAITELESLQDDRLTAILANIAQNGKTTAIKSNAAEAFYGKFRVQEYLGDYHFEGAFQLSR